MSWNRLVIDSDAEHAEALSDVLLEMGALSVDLLDADADTPDEQAIFGEPGEPPPGIWQHNCVTALFGDDQDVIAILERAVESVGLKHTPAYRIELLADNDWVRLTQSQFEPIQISKRLWIVPTWHTPSDPEAINIALDPGLAFGTGSHPTTRLCLRWLDANLSGGESVLDYGCGSGILAIAAIKLGAQMATGIDLDSQAITSGRENARANRADRVDFWLPGELDLGMYDLVIANILTNPLRMLAPILARATRPEGTIVLSGILDNQAEEVIQIYQQWFEMGSPVFDEGWSCLSGIRR
ncbi:MAG: 50S ribosomal protein L11 methyltransferase [Gallionella sp.]